METHPLYKNQPIPAFTPLEIAEMGDVKKHVPKPKTQIVKLQQNKLKIIS